MNDVETQLRQCLARNVAGVPTRADLMHQVQLRSRRLRRRRAALATSAALPVVAIGSAGAMAAATHHPVSPLPRGQGAPSLRASSAPSPSATSVYSDVYCPKGERPDLAVDEGHPLASGESGSPTDALAQRYGEPVGVLYRDSAMFLVDGRAAPSTESWFLVPDDAGKVVGSYLVDRRPDGSWRLWTATVDGCRSA